MSHSVNPPAAALTPERLAFIKSEWEAGYYERHCESREVGWLLATIAQRDKDLEIQREAKVEFGRQRDFWRGKANRLDEQLGIERQRASNAVAQRDNQAKRIDAVLRLCEAAEKREPDDWVDQVITARELRAALEPPDAEPRKPSICAHCGEEETPVAVEPRERVTDA